MLDTEIQNWFWSLHHHMQPLRPAPATLGRQLHGAAPLEAAFNGFGVNDTDSRRQVLTLQLWVCRHLANALGFIRLQHSHRGGRGVCMHDCMHVCMSVCVDTHTHTHKHTYCNIAWGGVW